MASSTTALVLLGLFSCASGLALKCSGSEVPVGTELCLSEGDGAVVKKVLQRLNDLEPEWNSDHMHGPIWDVWEDPILFNTSTNVLLDKILPYYHEAIMNPKQKGVLQHMLGQIPTVMTRGLILESRLAADDHRVDISLHATRSRGADLMMAGHPHLPESVTNPSSHLTLAPPPAETKPLHVRRGSFQPTLSRLAPRFPTSSPPWSRRVTFGNVSVPSPSLGS